MFCASKVAETEGCPNGWPFFVRTLIHSKHNCLKFHHMMKFETNMPFVHLIT